MVTVAEQIELDNRLSAPLKTIRAYLKSLGLEGDLDRFLDGWDEAIRISDFKRVAEQYPSLIRNVLLRAAGWEVDNWQVDDTEKHHWRLTLLRAAVLDNGSPSLEGLDEADIDGACVELGGMLEAMDIYCDASAYLNDMQPTVWLSEHADINDIITRDPILLYEFVFDFETFLVNLSDTQNVFSTAGYDFKANWDSRTRPSH